MTDWEFTAGAGDPDMGTVRWTLPAELAEDLAALPEEELRAMKKTAELMLEKAVRLAIGVIYSRDRTVLEQFLIFTSELATHHLRQAEESKPNKFDHWQYVDESVGALLWTPDEIVQGRLSASPDENRRAMEELMQHLLGQFARLATIMISSKKSSELILEHQKWTQGFLDRALKTLD